VRKEGAHQLHLPTVELTFSSGLIAAYLLAVALFASLGIPKSDLVAATAFSPAKLSSGQLWLLPASGFVVDGETWGQLAELAQVACVLVALRGAGAFWRAAIAGHVGSTLVAYAGVGLLYAVSPSAVAGISAVPDYGVSCVWAGALGALGVALSDRCPDRARGLMSIAACGLPVVAVSTTMGLASTEHLLAFVLGAFASQERFALTPRLRERLAPAFAAHPVST
jgi:hypothetical protein